MSESIIVPASPQLSRGFDKARRISRVLALLLAIGFWVTLAWLIATPIALVFPHAGSFDVGTTALSGTLSLRAGLSVATALMIATLPALFILHHTRRVFVHYAKGEVFMAAPIAHIRAAGLWLMVCLFATIAGQIVLTVFGGKAAVAHLDPTPMTLFVGIGVYVTAYVMAEARRIAEDNAGIV
jgi:hypothetical protein